MNLPDYSDVQGLAAYGYARLTQARYLLLRIRNADAARSWLSSAPASTAEYRKPGPETALQVAFTPEGLRVLNVPEKILAGFSDEFLYGMAGDANRSRRLGDTGANSPSHWLWGRPGDTIHLVVMLFAVERLEQWQQAVQTAAWNDAFETLFTLDTSDFGGHEPFGFTDGISQPEFDWSRKQASRENTITYSNIVALGELLLGYPNEYGKYTDRPLLETADDPGDDLLPAEDHAAKKDLGRNGTFLVLRQLEQDVRGFWQYLAAAGAGDPKQLGACMVGRTIDGDPLIPASHQAIPGVTDAPGQPRNAFTYDDDLMGVQCPFGAHIRRANPRNADLFGRPANAISRTGNILGIPRAGLRNDLMASTRFHRVLRRGREYGPKLTPEEALRPGPPATHAGGLHFACLGANIARQFEFVQNAWLMSTKFNSLNEESDPLLGNRAAGDHPQADYFSIPREGRAPRRLTGVPQFITVRGGAYFFLPSIRVLRYLARGGTNTLP